MKRDLSVSAVTIILALTLSLGLATGAYATIYNSCSSENESPDNSGDGNACIMDNGSPHHMNGSTAEDKDSTVAGTPADTPTLESVAGHLTCYYWPKCISHGN